MAIEVIRHSPSTNIAQITYDTETQTLTIQFAKGGSYEYYEVPEDAARGFESAFSTTKYFNSFIENVFPSQRLV